MPNVKSLVVYDSQFGNTKKVAETIGEVLSRSGSILIRHVSEVQAGDLGGIDTLVVGSPTQQLSATEAIKTWLNSLPAESLRGVQAAAFDTRFTKEKITELSQILTFFVSIFGYGAKPIASRLARKGARLVLEPEGFYVGDTEGPLLSQELVRVSEWASQLGTKSL
jgi:menaquinone-dependent protoporphyrinogen IX oxidase